MPIDWELAHQTYLLADTGAGGVVTLLANTYDGRPAVFVGRAPKSATLPYVIVRAAVTEIPAFMHKQETGWEAIVDVQVFTDGKGSTKLVQSIAQRVKELYEYFGGPTISGYQVVDYGVESVVPVDEDQVMGRSVQTRVVVS